DRHLSPRALLRSATNRTRQAGGRMSTFAGIPKAYDVDDSLAGAPDLYLTPATRPTLVEAQAWCRHLATTHYENFHVATFFLPATLRPHFHCIYAFCRTSDDLGDEVASTDIALRLLSSWRTMLHQCFGQPEASRHPVFVALHPTIAEKRLPQQPFDDLITAFEHDQAHTHHESLASLEEYSRYSANPVGRLVLLVSGYSSEEMMLLSDDICTGLQLANFYQDIVEDHARGRRYIPADAMQRFGISDQQIAERRFDPNFRAMMQFLVEDARARLLRGSRLISLVDHDLAATLSLFVKGGLSILDAIAAQDYNTLQSRPVVTKVAKLRLLGGALLGKLSATLRPRKRSTP
ncbi:MAG: squalene synthase HpnC, partial [Bryocella sp.]